MLLRLFSIQLGTSTLDLGNLVQFPQRRVELPIEIPGEPSEKDLEIVILRAHNSGFQDENME